MQDDFRNGLKALLKATSRLEKDVGPAVEKLVDGAAQLHVDFESRRKALKEDMDRGARLTDHRISL
ncbi:hypothetical protein [Magnetospirillum sp. UT-4]|uniref:hypothetical protein n=1 Tax=Magnetospirillum sp. UT-4 TaxID=2681467 RepID=UPI001572A3E6|nr:hypothetical protein [Magnetospirillum sp. UT-4]